MIVVVQQIRLQKGWENPLFEYVNKRISKHKGIDCVTVELLQSEGTHLFDDYMIVSRWNRFIYQMDAEKNELFDITRSGNLLAGILQYEFFSFKMDDSDNSSVALSNLYYDKPPTFEKETVL